MGLKAVSLGPGEVPIWPYNTMLVYSPLGNPLERSRDREQDKIKVAPRLPRGLGTVSKETGTWKTCMHRLSTVPSPLIAIISQALSPKEGSLRSYSFHMASWGRGWGGETSREFYPQFSNQLSSSTIESNPCPSAYYYYY